MLFRTCAITMLMVWSASGSRIRTAPAGRNGSERPAVADAAKIEAIREKLLKMSSGLSKIIDPSGPLAKTELGPEMAEFNARVRSVVNSTAGKSDRKSLEQLEEVLGSVTGLVKDLNQQQSRLMQEGDEQRESLLLGVLMAQKGEPMAKQLEVLGSPDFAGLAATRAILARRDAATPLFQQVADFLDAHAGNGSRAGARRSGAVAHVVASLKASLAHLEHEARHAEDAHANATKRAKALEMTKDNRSAKLVRAIERKEDRRFQKMVAIQRRDISSMKDAISAVEQGDMQGLDRARAALENSMKSMQSKNSGFLVLIQEGLRASGLDCPYCAAQCVDKCHDEGKQYVVCLEECKDAGK